MDATGFGYRKGQIPQMPVFSFNADDNLRRLAAEVCKEVNRIFRYLKEELLLETSLSAIGMLRIGVSEFSAYATEMERCSHWTGSILK